MDLHTSDFETAVDPRRGCSTLPTGTRRPRVSTPRVLLVDDDGHAAETFAYALRQTPIDLVSVHTGGEGLTAARAQRFSALLVDLRLPDMQGVDFIRTLHADGIRTPFIVVTGFATVPVAVEMMKLGASALLEKPVDVDDLLQVLRSTIDGGSAAAPRPSPLGSWMLAPVEEPVALESEPLRPQYCRSTAERWASFVVRATQSDYDPKTLELWARHANVSRSVLSECCRLVHVSPHAARDFARVMRAILKCGDRWQPEAVMDFSDTRTLRKLLGCAGLAGATHVPTLDEFFDRQHWIPRDNPGLLALRALTVSLAGR